MEQGSPGEWERGPLRFRGSESEFTFSHSTSRALTPNIQFNKEVFRMKALLYLVLLVLMLC